MFYSFSDNTLRVHNVVRVWGNGIFVILGEGRSNFLKSLDYFEHDTCRFPIVGVQYVGYGILVILVEDK